MSRWPMVPLGEVLHRYDDWVLIDPDSEYQQVTIRLWGKGLNLRTKTKGTGIAASSQNRVRTGLFLLSKIDARNGAFGLVPPDLDGAVVSADFPAYEVQASQAHPRYLEWMSKTGWFIALCKQSSEGSTNRVRLKEDRFLAEPVPLPPIDVQARIVAQLDDVAGKVAVHEAAADRVEKELQATLSAAFAKITAGAERALMGDVAPLVRRSVEIDPLGKYPEIGVRSFGKGTFHKPTISGLDVGSKEIYEIRTGDLIINLTFAWEGAVAIANERDDHRFASHRFLTFQANKESMTAEFLRFYWLSVEGQSRIHALSPGSAGRNRVLSLTKLIRENVPLPSSDALQWFDALQAKAAAIRRAQAAAKVDADSLLLAMLNRVFGT